MIVDTSMPPSTAERTVTIALIGNPNTGKSTLFTALAGVRQRVGNYPGVTVEKKLGRMSIDGRHLPWSTCPAPTASRRVRRTRWSPSMCCWAGQGHADPPDVVVCIVDASNLERNLYLVSQVLELGLPTVVALNMIDLAENKGMKIDVAAELQQLNVAVVAYRRIVGGVWWPLRQGAAAVPARRAVRAGQPVSAGVSG